MWEWRARYADKVVTADEAIRGIPAGRRILIGSGAAEPVSLVKAMVEQGNHLADNEVVHLLTLGPAPYVEPAHAERFRHIAFFIGANVRSAVQEGRADFMPVFLSEIPELIRSQRVRIDVALIQVSPPDAHGYVSLGVSVDIVRSAVESATTVIAEVNPRMPQLGGHKDLGVHTEMFSDGVMRLGEAGVITGRRKTLLPGKLVTSFIMGSKQLYEWAHENPAIEMRSSDYTNDPAVIASNDRMIAINGALAVDLTGQVASDTLGAASSLALVGRWTSSVGQGAAGAASPSSPYLPRPRGAR